MNTIKKHSITVAGHTTSVSLEDAFWQELLSLAKNRGQSVNALVTEIDAKRDPALNLSSALRLYVLAVLKEKLLSQ